MVFERFQNSLIIYSKKKKKKKLFNNVNLFLKIAQLGNTCHIMLWVTKQILIIPMAGWK